MIDHLSLPIRISNTRRFPLATGRLTEGSERSNRFPNCTFFRNWVNVDDTITWEAEVGASGKYRVEIEYACPEEDVGATIQLSFNESKLKGKIAEAHDPPLRGGENDRHPRQESYVKDFKTMELGTIELNKRQGNLDPKRPGETGTPGNGIPATNADAS